MFVADKLSKHTMFVSLECNNTAKDTSRVFYDEIYKHNGVKSKIISGRGKQLTTNFWNNERN